MHPKTVGPRAAEPNYRARELFFAQLDGEWPSLKESLVETVWPAYRACWRPSEIGSGDVPRGHILSLFVDDDVAFVAPLAVTDWYRLTSDRRCADLHRALSEWGSIVKVRDDWFLASALFTLSQFSPSQDKPGHPVRAAGPNLANAIDTATYTEPFEWCYHHEFDGRDWGYSFEPKFLGTIWEPNGPALWLPNKSLVGHYDTWDQFQRRMLSQFKKELSRYRKSIMSHWGLNKMKHVAYARWTIARVSGLSWRKIVARYPELQVYVDGEAQAKKRVREFALEIGLTLDTQPIRKKNQT